MKKQATPRNRTERPPYLSVAIPIKGESAALTMEEIA